MKKLILILTMMLIAVSAFADVYVQGYTRKDGTYVQPHYRSNPDGNPYNNYSSKGNYNPYTGEAGTVLPNPYYGGGTQSVSKKSIFSSGHFGN
jgi:hypothetical protein